MEGGNYSSNKPKSINLKQGGFLFASAPQRTEEETVPPSSSSLSGAEGGPPTTAAASSQPSPSSQHNRLIKTLGVWSKDHDEVPDMAAAVSLRERLRQYQTLKAEQLTGTVLPAPADASPGDDDEHSFLGPATTAATASALSAAVVGERDEAEATEPIGSDPPEESWVPSSQEEAEGITVEEIVEYPDEGYEEEEIFQDQDDDEDVGDEEEEYEVQVEEEVQDEEEEFEEEEYVPSAASAAALVGAGVVGAAAVDAASVDSAGQPILDDDQDVFRALDEAERAEGINRSVPIQNQQASPPPAAPRQSTTVTSRSAEPPQADKEKGRQNMILAGIVVVGALAIVAIVLPFVLTYGDDPSPSGGPPSNTPSLPSAPTVPNAPSLPSAPSVPSAPTVPTAPSPTPPTPPSEQIPTTEPAPTPNPEPTISPMPTESPTTLRFGQFVEQFLIPISGEEVFQDINSPQFRAAEYIANVDPYTSEITTLGELEDRYASVTFYFATDGDNWDTCYLNDTSCESGQWLVGNVCEWFAVGCDEEQRISSYTFLQDNGLKGALPMEIFLMSNMMDFFIVNNTLTGSLPEAFGQNATSVRSLVLSGNDLTGTVPDFYLENSPVELFSLADNNFSGPIPMNLGNGTILAQLDLSGNSFSGSIPIEIAFYETLDSLVLSSNRFTGDIPDGIYAIETLLRLQLDGNPLTGTLSPFIRNLGLLEVLRVGNSNIGGFLPDELFTLTNLVELNVGGAEFDGGLSVGFVNLAPSLRTLVVNNNSLDGSVPSVLGLLTNLNVLQLQANDFFGSIPVSICDLRGDGPDDLRILTADCEELSCSCCTECF